MRVTQKSFCKENNPCQNMLWQGLLVLKVGFWVSPFFLSNNIDIDQKLNNSMSVSCRTLRETFLCRLLRSLTPGSG